MARKKKPAVAWPLEDGQYLSTLNISRSSVSVGPAVSTLRAALGLPQGSYDESVRQAVIGAQKRAGRAVTGVVDRGDWDAIVNPPRRPRLATPTGGVNGADKADDAVGELDPPQGPQ